MDARKWLYPLLTVVGGVAMYMGADVDEATKNLVVDQVNAAIAAGAVAAATLYGLFKRLTGGE